MERTTQREEAWKTIANILFKYVVANTDRSIEGFRKLYCDLEEQLVAEGSGVFHVDAMPPDEMKLRELVDEIGGQLLEKIQQHVGGDDGLDC